MGSLSTAVASRWSACVWVTRIAPTEHGSNIGSTSNVLPFSRTSGVACRRSLISTKSSASFSGVWRRLLPYPFMRIEGIERSGRS